MQWCGKTLLTQQQLTSEAAYRPWNPQSRTQPRHTATARAMQTGCAYARCRCIQHMTHATAHNTVVQFALGHHMACTHMPEPTASCLLSNQGESKQRKAACKVSFHHNCTPLLQCKLCSSAPHTRQAPPQLAAFTAVGHSCSVHPLQPSTRHSKRGGLRHMVVQGMRESCSPHAGSGLPA